ncbi:hypothetical protein HGRIS_011909 [Hohenbuehelia grisea]|uniref:Lysine-specific metallo-endopeptidase domain-containing protein n=1 Tax=Hohenbuehelia grisea TaxID=104357 RepID=A0ABR3JYU2_9AGAR
MSAARTPTLKASISKAQVWQMNAKAYFKRNLAAPVDGRRTTEHNDFLRYKYWFGQPDPKTFVNVKQRYDAIIARNIDVWTFRCVPLKGTHCEDENDIASTFSDQPDIINICEGYFHVDADEQAQALIHEASHWHLEKIHGTNKGWSYFFRLKKELYEEKVAHQLALDQPGDATENADNYGYFGKYLDKDCHELVWSQESKTTQCVLL